MVLAQACFGAYSASPVNVNCGGYGNPFTDTTASPVRDTGKTICVPAYRFGVAGTLTDVKMRFYHDLTGASCTVFKLYILSGTPGAFVAKHEITSSGDISLVDQLNAASVGRQYFTVDISTLSQEVEADEFLGAYFDGAFYTVKNDGNGQTSIFSGDGDTMAMTTRVKSDLLWQTVVSTSEFILYDRYGDGETDSDGGWRGSCIVPIDTPDTGSYYVILEGTQVPDGESLSISLEYTDAGGVNSTEKTYKIDYSGGPRDGMIYGDPVNGITKMQSVAGQEGDKIDYYIFVDPVHWAQNILFCNFTDGQGFYGDKDTRHISLMGRETGSFTASSKIRRLRLTNSGGNASVGRIVVARKPIVVVGDSFTSGYIKGTCVRISLGTDYKYYNAVDNHVSSSGGTVASDFAKDLVAGHWIETTSTTTTDWAQGTTYIGGHTILSNVGAKLAEAGVFSQRRYVINGGISGNGLTFDNTNDNFSTTANRVRWKSSGSYVMAPDGKYYEATASHTSTKLGTEADDFAADLAAGRWVQTPQRIATRQLASSWKQGRDYIGWQADNDLCAYRDVVYCFPNGLVFWDIVSGMNGTVSQQDRKDRAYQLAGTVGEVVGDCASHLRGLEVDSQNDVILCQMVRRKGDGTSSADNLAVWDAQWYLNEALQILAYRMRIPYVWLWGAKYEMTDGVHFTDNDLEVVGPKIAQAYELNSIPGYPLYSSGPGSCPAADLTGDCRVDFKDLAILTSQWLSEGPMVITSPVNFVDYAVFASQWQQGGVDLQSDLDGNGFVDGGDLLIFVSRWLQ